CLGVSVLNSSAFLFFLCVCAKPTFRYCGKNAFVFAFSADFSLSSAATAQQLHGGEHTGAFRDTRVISAASAERPAAQKCQFSGFSAASCPSFRRKICILCNNCQYDGIKIKKVLPHPLASSID